MKKYFGTVKVGMNSIFTYLIKPTDLTEEITKHDMVNAAPPLHFFSKKKFGKTYKKSIFNLILSSLKENSSKSTPYIVMLIILKFFKLFLCFFLK